MVTNTSLGKALQEARKYIRLSQSAIAEKLNITRQIISAIESGKREISAAELKFFCNVYRISPNDLLGLDVVDHDSEAMSNIDFRMNDDKELTKHDLREIKEFSQRKFPYSSEYFERWEQSFNKYINLSKSPFESIKKIVSTLRRELKQQQPPINLFLMVEELGVIVVPTYLEKVAAVVFYSSKTDRVPPRILVNCNQPVDRQRFSIGHELAHLFLHNKEEAPHPHYFKRQFDKKEIDADMFSAELLMPRELLQQSIEQIKNKPSLEEVVFLLSWLYQVSFLAMSTRLYNLNLITREVFDDLGKIKPSKIESSINKTTNSRPFFPEKHLYSLKKHIFLTQKPWQLNQDVIRKLQEMAYTRYIGEETQGGSIPSILYELEPANIVYEKVTLWVAKEYPLFKDIEQNI